MPDQTQDQTNEAARHPSGATNDAKGTMPGDRGDAKAVPSGYRGDNPATAGTGETKVSSNTPANAVQEMNPSSPGNTGTTPGSDGK